ncbi:hypothetical protein NDU88_003930 [Pleurodeles waltl]|uniref:Uncharacterized protein n=1 Tax=Pleurodeles waltl TaxID=8319 RepID=A0AAV7TSI2_PLEWA|nr:hypothetical protein NDU88_003930 [Pleurodeles waltl]
MRKETERELRCNKRSHPSAPHRQISKSARNRDYIEQNEKVELSGTLRALLHRSQSGAEWCRKVISSSLTPKKQEQLCREKVLFKIIVVAGYILKGQCVNHL